MPRNRELQREAAKRYYWKKYKKSDEPTPRNDFDNYDYKVVPDSWRKQVNVRPDYKTQDIISPLVTDLINGKTIFVNYTVPVGSKRSPFRTLYNYFNRRGYKLRIHTFDDVQGEQYRKTLLWIEPLGNLNG